MEVEEDTEEAKKDAEEAKKDDQDGKTEVTFWLFCVCAVSSVFIDVNV